MNMWKGKDKMFKEFVKKPKHTIDDLLYIIEILRGPDGCPWDREQNHRSIRNNFIEETYEAVEAIDKDDPELLKEELGDVLLQVVFHSRMEQEANVFDFSDVCDEVCKKLILRHPHVFSDFDAKTSDAVLDNWEKIKQKTKGQKLQADALLSVPKVFPALIRSQKVQKRAARAGFDYPDMRQFRTTTANPVLKSLAICFLPLLMCQDFSASARNSHFRLRRRDSLKDSRLLKNWQTKKELI